MGKARIIAFFIILVCFLGFFIEPIMMKKQEEAFDTVMFDNGKIVTEKTEAKGWLHFLYNNTIGRFVRYIARTQLVSKLTSIYKDSFLSKYKISKFINRYNIDIDECVIPKGGYRSFNDFFIRKLKPGARRIEPSPDALVSPADSKLMVFPELTDNIRFFVKSQKFNLDRFLKDKILAQKYKHGTMLVFRLAPYDYHRYHFPCDCTPLKARNIMGYFDSVNPFVYKVGYQPLLENERHVTILKTNGFGDIAMVSVGAMLVGRIIETYFPEAKYAKGDEMGYFAFGGSTLVLLFQKGEIRINDRFIQHSKENIETVVKMGEAVAWRSTRL